MCVCVCCVCVCACACVCVCMCACVYVCVYLNKGLVIVLKSINFVGLLFSNANTQTNNIHLNMMYLAVASLQCAPVQ